MKFVVLIDDYPNISQYFQDNKRDPRYRVGYTTSTVQWGTGNVTQRPSRDRGSFRADIPFQPQPPAIHKLYRAVAEIQGWGRQPRVSRLLLRTTTTNEGGSLRSGMKILHPSLHRIIPHRSTPIPCSRRCFAPRLQRGREKYIYAVSRREARIHGTAETAT